MDPSQEEEEEIQPEIKKEKQAGLKTGEQV